MERNSRTSAVRSALNRVLDEAAGVMAAGKWTRPEGDNLNLAHFVVVVGERRRDLEWCLITSAS